MKKQKYRINQFSVVDTNKETKAEIVRKVVSVNHTTFNIPAYRNHLQQTYNLNNKDFKTSISLNYSEVPC